MKKKSGEIMKDSSVFLCLGATNHSKGKRHEADFYATDPNALKIFLEKLKEDNFKLPQNICEPACGAGHLSEELKRHGYNVSSFDLYDYGYGTTGIDFLKSHGKVQCILTNPPYKYALEFVQHALKNVYKNGLVIMLLKVQFLEGIKRNMFFKRYPPKFIYVNSKRQNCAKNADFDKYYEHSAMCYAWFIWQKGFKGEPRIRWID